MSDREGIVEETTVPQDVVDAVLDRVREYDYVTFCEIENILRDHGIDPRGNIALSFEELPNICFWANMSEAMVATYDAIRPHTDMDSAHWLTYLSDGCVLRLPIAKQFRKGVGYKKPHWAPVCFRPKGRVPMGKRR